MPKAPRALRRRSRGPPRRRGLRYAHATVPGAPCRCAASADACGAGSGTSAAQRLRQYGRRARALFLARARGPKLLRRFAVPGLVPCLEHENRPQVERPVRILIDMLAPSPPHDGGIKEPLMLQACFREQVLRPVTQLTPQPLCYGNLEPALGAIKHRRRD